MFYHLLQAYDDFLDQKRLEKQNTQNKPLIKQPAVAQQQAPAATRGDDTRHSGGDSKSAAVTSTPRSDGVALNVDTNIASVHLTPTVDSSLIPAGAVHSSDIGQTLTPPAADTTPALTVEAALTDDVISAPEKFSTDSASVLEAKQDGGVGSGSSSAPVGESHVTNTTNGSHFFLDYVFCVSKQYLFLIRIFLILYVHVILIDN